MFNDATNSITFLSVGILSLDIWSSMGTGPRLTEHYKSYNTLDNFLSTTVTQSMMKEGRKCVIQQYTQHTLLTSRYNQTLVRPIQITDSPVDNWSVCP